MSSKVVVKLGWLKSQKRVNNNEKFNRGFAKINLRVANSRQ